MIGRPGANQWKHADGPDNADWVTERRPKMPTLPPAANHLFPQTTSPWLAPIRFRVKPFLQYCRSLDEALGALEARFPSHPRVLTLEVRDHHLKRSRKRKPK